MSTLDPVRSLWLRWKSLRLPWRRRWLVGSDLAGNTFWEFKDTLNANRLRRTAQFGRKIHYSDIQISPQWHQWLRHSRLDPPTIAEQQGDLQRQTQLKYLAQAADERWAAKPSFLDAPKERSQPAPATVPRDKGGYVGQTGPDEKEGVRNLVGGVGEVGDVESESQQSAPKQKAEKKNPWDVKRGNPGQEWQPASWTPGPSKR